MRSLLVSALLLVSVAAYSQAKPPQKTRRAPAVKAPSAAQSGATRQFEQDQKAIAELQQREITATMAVDVNELLSTWADDAVLLPPNHPPVVGREALMTFYEEYKKKLGNDELMGYDENWQEVQVAGDWAHQWGTISARVRPAAGGDEIPVALHVIRVLKRQPDGAWVVARAIYNNAPGALKGGPESRPAPQPKPPQ